MLATKVPAGTETAPNLYEVCLPGGAPIRIRSAAKRDWANAVFVQGHLVGVFDSGTEPEWSSGVTCDRLPAERIE
mgnify:CR=1 FL=1